MFSVDTSSRAQLTVSGDGVPDSDYQTTGTPHVMDKKPALDTKASIYPSFVDMEQAKKGLKFKMCMVTVMIASFLFMLELGGVGTALPVIVSDLHGSEFEWVGSAYALSATAFLPFTGGLAQVFGRRIVMLLQIFLFALGSTLCGAAPSLSFLIAGRTIQGIGAGGIASLSQIIIADLVPLQERGPYNALILVAYFLGAAIAPPTAGALAESGQWRWFFYMNLPFCGLTAIFIILFLDLKVPRGTLSEKLWALDWIGNILIIAGTTSMVLALTWGGLAFRWGSVQVLVPLILGIVIMICAFTYEDLIPRNPLIPTKVLKSRTAVAGYAQAFLGSFFLLGILFYLPVYFQACKFASPLRSGVLGLPVALVPMPFGMISGIFVAKSGKYREPLYLAWVTLILSGFLLSTLTVDSSLGSCIAYEFLAGVGSGILLVTAIFPVLAPLPISLNAHATSFFMFVRFFSQVWGVTIGGTVMQNELTRRLPTEFISQFPGGTSIAYSIIPAISSLEEPFRREVQDAFAESLRVFWYVLGGTASLGLVVALLMKAFPLHTSNNREWGLNEEENNRKQGDKTMEMNNVHV